jgi:retinol dehydrogenase 12
MRAVTEERRVALVTGATGGIGLETARGLARAGFHVVVLGRSEERGRAAQAELAATVPWASTELVLADLAEQAQVRAAAARVLERHDRLDRLVNNAGVAYRRTPKHRTSEGHDPLLAVNHLGPFLLTNLLVPLLVGSAPARIVNVASRAHRIGRLDLNRIDHPRSYGLGGFRWYGSTKLMNILFTRELARRLEGTGVTANVVHPGSVATNIGSPGRFVSAVTRRTLLSPTQGAATTLHVATSPEGGRASGAYFATSARADRKLGRRARDDELGARLWARSEELVGERFEPPTRARRPARS